MYFYFIHSNKSILADTNYRLFKAKEVLDKNTLHILNKWLKEMRKMKKIKKNSKNQIEISSEKTYLNSF